VFGIGEELKAARQKRGITFSEVSKTTKIDTRFLKALEEENFDILPEPYIKAFLRSYAHEIGANLASVMRKYEDMRSQSAETAVSPPGPSPFQESQFTSFNNAVKQIAANFAPIWKAHKKYALLSIAVIALATLIVALISVRPQTYIESIHEPSAADESAVSSSGIPLTVKALKPLYLMVSIDGGDSLDFNLMSGEVKDFRAEKKFWIFTSNAQNSAFTLNSKSLDKITGEGLCAYFTADSTGVSQVKTYRLARK